MKIKIYFLLFLCASAATGYAQTKSLRNSFSFGGGNQSYNGDLGNSWFEPEEEWYGQITIQFRRYLNRSFDASFQMSSGDYGHCREDDEPEFRPDGSLILNMLSRLTTGVFALNYKFANGYILKEDARLGIDNISNFFWTDKNRVHTGTFGSVNAGWGLRYNFNKRFHVAYQMGFGMFNTDRIDERVEGSNDKYLQQSVLIGINF